PLPLQPTPHKGYVFLSAPNISLHRSPSITSHQHRIHFRSSSSFTVKTLSDPSKYRATPEMAKGLIWATVDDLARNRGRVLSLYRQMLRSLNSPKLPLNLAARLAKKAEVRVIFMLGAEERSLHNIADLIDTAEYSLSLLRKGIAFLTHFADVIHLFCLMNLFKSACR
ncbi:hypothetical protein CFOL_v3_00810, partial [Cephalotus follicularis]